MTETATPPKDAEQQAEEDREGLVLDLEEFVEPEDRPFIHFRTKEQKAAGEEPKRYDLRVPEEFGVVEEQEYRSESREYNELRIAPKKLNKAQRARYVQLLDNLFGKVLIAPDEVKAKFTEHQKQAVVTLFTTALLTEDAASVQRALPMIARTARDELSTTEI